MGNLRMGQQFLLLLLSVLEPINQTIGYIIEYRIISIDPSESDQIFFLNSFHIEC